MEIKTGEITKTFPLKIETRKPSIQFFNTDFESLASTIR